MNTLGSEKIGLEEIRSKHGAQSFMDVMGCSTYLDSNYGFFEGLEQYLQSW